VILKEVTDELNSLAITQAYQASEITRRPLLQGAKSYGRSSEIYGLSK
jgi:hypothetical protein